MNSWLAVSPFGTKYVFAARTLFIIFLSSERRANILTRGWTVKVRRRSCPSSAFFFFFLAYTLLVRSLETPSHAMVSFYLDFFLHCRYILKTWNIWAIYIYIFNYVAKKTLSNKCFIWRVTILKKLSFFFFIQITLFVGFVVYSMFWSLKWDSM